MASSTLIIEAPWIHSKKVRCQECSREKLEGEVVVMGDTTRCFDCWVLHKRRLAAFLLPDGEMNATHCTTCRGSLYETGNFRGYMTIIDGAYGLHCLSCRDAYRLKRKDLYRDTRLGAHLKL